MDGDAELLVLVSSKINLICGNLQNPVVNFIINLRSKRPSEAHHMSVHLKVLYYGLNSSEYKCFLCWDQDTVIPLLPILSTFELSTLLTTNVFTSENSVNSKTMMSL